MVEQVTNIPKIKGLIPATGTRREIVAKMIRVKYFVC
jgi:hypothetical protein